MRDVADRIGKGAEFAAMEREAIGTSQDRAYSHTLPGIEPDN